MNFTDLPLVNACLNGLSSRLVLLLSNAATRSRIAIA
jgi:hypothetical protein